MLLNGRLDVVTPPVFAHELHSVLPSSELIVVEGCGHAGDDMRMVTALQESVERVVLKSASVYSLHDFATLNRLI